MWKVGFESYLSVKLKRTIIMALNHIFKCKLKNMCQQGQFGVRESLIESDY